MNIITIPLPDKGLSPNGRVNRGKLARLKREMTERVCWAVREQAPELVGQKWERATIQYHFYFSTNRNRDDDNYAGSMKSARDAFEPTSYWKSGKKKGLVKRSGVGVIADDSGFTQLKTIMGLDKENPRAEIHIRKETQ